MLHIYIYIAIYAYVVLWLVSICVKWYLINLDITFPKIIKKNDCHSILSGLEAILILATDYIGVHVSLKSGDLICDTIINFCTWSESQYVRINRAPNLIQIINWICYPQISMGFSNWILREPGDQIISDSFCNQI